MDSKKSLLIIVIIAVVIAAILLIIYPEGPIDKKGIIESARDLGIIMGQQPDMIESLSNQDFELKDGTMTTNGTKHSVDLKKILSGGPAKDGIPSIDNPKFISVQEAEQFLDNEKAGLSLEIEGQKRFYPFQILVWHEIVNDKIGNTPVLVTYCPLCGSGIVFDPVVNGEHVAFGTSGKLYNSNLVMYDRKTDSYWSQVTGTAIVGELTGTKLKIIPSTVVFWDDWKIKNPDGQVLSKNTGFSRNYNNDPYGGYYTDRSVFFPVDNTDDRLHPKAEVAGLETNEKFKAYDFAKIRELKVLNDAFNNLNIAVFADQSDQGIKVFNSELNGQLLEFKYQNGKLQDSQTSTTWDFNGLATEGQLKGAQLDEIGYFHTFWFAWAAVHPETELFN